MKIKRLLLDNLSAGLDQPYIEILLGPRQVGKSTLMEDLALKLKRQKKPFQFFNLELPDDLMFFAKPSQDIFKTMSKKTGMTFFIDEFHYLKNASKLFKSLYDCKRNLKIIASGSSSLEIHKHLRESLAGRRRLYKVFPLTLEEYLQSKRGVEDFIIFGAMPGIIHIKSAREKIEYLYQIVQAYLLKDIKSLIKYENIRAFNHLLFYIAEHQGQIMPTNNLSREIRLSSPSVEKYLEILENTFIVYGLNSYSRNLSNELKKSKKYYFFDNGIRNSLVKNFENLNRRKDKGILFESHVFLELKKRLSANMELHFWRTKQGEEVDFIWTSNQKPIPIEVKSINSPVSVPKSLIKFLKFYPSAPYGVIVNQKLSTNIKIEQYQIKFIKFNEIEKLFYPFS